MPTSGTADDALLRVADAVDRLMMWTRRQTTSTLSSSTAGTLDSLLHFGPLRVSELAERERISQPGMTTLINRLERDGLAERLEDPADRRATLVRITAAGRDSLRARHELRTRQLLEHLRELESDHRAVLAGAVDAFGALLRSGEPDRVPSGPDDTEPDRVPSGPDAAVSDRVPSGPEAAVSDQNRVHSRM